MEMKKLILNTIILAIAFTAVLTSLSAKEVNSDDSAIGAATCTSGCIYFSCSVSNRACPGWCTGTRTDGLVSISEGFPYNYKYKSTDGIPNPCTGDPGCDEGTVTVYECIGC